MGANRGKWGQMGGNGGKMDQPTDEYLRAVFWPSIAPSIWPMTALFCSSSLTMKDRIAVFCVGFSDKKGRFRSQSDMRNASVCGYSIGTALPAFSTGIFKSPSPFAFFIKK